MSIAARMVAIYEDNVEDNGHIPDDAFFDMMKLYGSAPEEMLENIFIEFLDLLDQHEIDYDLDEFKRSI
jgi:hypothetical protein|tara:strand:- start:4700 stop:4906 length:207 start_codon:yes stop_codon:yes gene_type:complete